MKKDFNYWSFEQAREYARGLNLNSLTEWRRLCKRDDFPEHIAKSPNRTFKDTGWINWLDWLNTKNLSSKNRAKQFYTYDEAEAFVRELNIANKSHWGAYCKSGDRPRSYIPSNPHVFYKDCGWSNWGTFLGNNRLSHKEMRAKFYTFKDARTYICTLGLKSKPDYKRWCEQGDRPEFIPYDPHTIYAKEGWQSWGHWLNTNNRSAKETGKAVIPYEKAREYVQQNLNIKSRTEWQQLCRDGKRPAFIPSNPRRKYNDDWISWYHFLGKKPKAFIPFEEARVYVQQNLNIKSPTEWRQLCRDGNRPEFIPANPHRSYKDWISWYHFLGKSPKGFIPLEDAREYVQGLDIKSRTEWQSWCKQGNRPAFIPSNPQGSYNDWISWYHFLGTSPKTFIPLEEARIYVQQNLNIKSHAEWQSWCKQGDRPAFIPYDPSRSYDDWISWYYFLGKKPNRKYPDYSSRKYPDYSRAFIDPQHFPEDKNVYLIVDDDTLIVNTIEGNQDESWLTVGDALRKVERNEYVELFELK